MNISSHVFRPTALGLALASVLASAGTAAERPVSLDVPPKVANDLAALPRIADPKDAAAKKINAALARLDAKARRAAVECTKGSEHSGTWTRSVRAPMRGPRFISYVITDDVYCGGAHPNVSTMAIVYDLATGSPIDWAAQLPPSFTGKLALSEGADGTKMIALSGKALYGAYLEGYRPRAPGAKAKDEDAECREAVSAAGFDGTPPGMMAWLDAKLAALVVSFDLPHAVEACADEVAIPLSVLRTAGAKPALIDAIEAAHRVEER